jgi:hypothetical protein
VLCSEQCYTIREELNREVGGVGVVVASLRRRWRIEGARLATAFVSADWSALSSRTRVFSPNFITSSTTLQVKDESQVRLDVRHLKPHDILGYVMRVRYLPFYELHMYSLLVA